MQKSRLKTNFTIHDVLDIAAQDYNDDYDFSIEKEKRMMNQYDREIEKSNGILVRLEKQVHNSQ